LLPRAERSVGAKRLVSTSEWIGLAGLDHIVPATKRVGLAGLDHIVPATLVA
jgi:hypothetical protein